MSDVANSYKTSTGLLEEFTGPVTDAFFRTNAKIQNGQVLLLHLVIDAEESEEPVTQLFSCGQGWETVDGGKSVQDEGGKADRTFNRQSAYGRLLDRVATPVDKGGLDILGVFEERGIPATQAAAWLGLNFDWKSEPFTWTDRETNEVKEGSRTLPIKFNGVTEGGAKKASTPAKPADDKAAKIAAAKAKAAAKANGGGQSLRDRLVGLAKEAGTNEEFVDAALAIDGVAEDDELLSAVVDESIFAEAHA